MAGNRISSRTMGRLRLVSQWLVPVPSAGPQGEIPERIARTVRWMTAMQAQDLQAARYLRFLGAWPT